jgi:alanine dehydrogenase
MKIGIIKEGKIPADNRTPLTPRQCSELMEEWPNVTVEAQWSAVRCYTEEDYVTFGVQVKETVADCDLLLGIKEVPVDDLVAGKAYMFFSHTIKKQPYNRKLLQAILEKKITLIDYELLTDEHGIRLIGFGRWAGIVGGHDALLMLGERTGAYKLKHARDCVNLQELVDQYDTIQIPPATFVITGGGRVAQGAREIMEFAKIREVSPEEFIKEKFDEPVYTQLHSNELYKRKQSGGFDKNEFYHHPNLYESNFERFIGHTDVLINCMFWDPGAPALFKEKGIKNTPFRMRIIADISCDIDGSVPITHRPTSIEDPVFGYHTATSAIGKPYMPDTIDVMAVPNLPNELPRDASRDFGIVLKDKILPEYFTNPESPLFERATIARAGRLTPRYSYLQDFADGKE